MTPSGAPGQGREPCRFRRSGRRCQLNRPVTETARRPRRTAWRPRSAPGWWVAAWSRSAVLVRGRDPGRAADRRRLGRSPASSPSSGCCSSAGWAWWLLRRRLGAAPDRRGVRRTAARRRRVPPPRPGRDVDEVVAASPGGEPCLVLHAHRRPGDPAADGGPGRRPRRRRPRRTPARARRAHARADAGADSGGPATPA